MPRVIASLLVAGLADRVIIPFSPQVRGPGDGVVGKPGNGNGVTADVLGLNSRSVVHLVGGSVIVAVSIGASAAAPVRE